MRRRTTMPWIAAGLLASLGGCAAVPVGPAIDRATLAAICPVPTRWTRDEAVEVADTLDRAGDERGIGRLAAEWERLNDAAKICRGAE